jgi:hypothetical protein
MEYKLYTTVDITSTGQYRPGADKEILRWKEQNFQTVLQTIGIRANIVYNSTPDMLEVAGNLIGFATDQIIHVWKFTFNTEQDNLFQNDHSSVGHLLDDFNGVPYISGLDESMEQNYSVFVTEGTSQNIIFSKK